MDQIEENSVIAIGWCEFGDLSVLNATREDTLWIID